MGESDLVDVWPTSEIDVRSSRPAQIVVAKTLEEKPERNSGWTDQVAEFVETR